MSGYRWTRAAAHWIFIEQPKSEALTECPGLGSAELLTIAKAGCWAQRRPTRDATEEHEAVSLA